MKNAQALNFKLWILALLAFVVPACNKPLHRNTYSGTVRVRPLVPKAMKIIQQGLIDRDPRIRVKAIEVVATTKQTQLMPKVQQLLKDDYVPVRFAAALAVRL